MSYFRDGFLSTVAKSIKRVGAVGSLSTSMEHENLEESMRKVRFLIWLFVLPDYHIDIDLHFSKL